jgi:hypothetical protein
MKYMITDGKGRYAGRLALVSPYTLNPEEHGYVFDTEGRYGSPAPVEATVQRLSRELGVELIAVDFVTGAAVKDSGEGH